MLSTEFGWPFVYNLIFWTHIMNRDYGAAEKVFVNDLHQTLDMDVLQRAIRQSDQNVSIEHVNKALFNVYNSFLFQRLLPDFENKMQIRIRAEIQEILVEKKR